MGGLGVEGEEEICGVVEREEGEVMLTSCACVYYCLCMSSLCKLPTNLRYWSL